MANKKLIQLIGLVLALVLATPAAIAQDRRRLGTKARAGLSAGAGAGIGAGVGALLGGKRGAATGTLLGGGGATAAWLLKSRDGRQRLGKYGQPIATIGAGTALGAGVGNLIDRNGKKGAAVGALPGGGGATATYLLTNRNRRPRYAYNQFGDNGYRPKRYRRAARRGCRC